MDMAFYSYVHVKTSWMQVQVNRLFWKALGETKTNRKILQQQQKVHRQTLYKMHGPPQAEMQTFQKD